MRRAALCDTLSVCSVLQACSCFPVFHFSVLAGNKRLRFGIYSFQKKHSVSLRVEQNSLFKLGNIRERIRVINHYKIKLFVLFVVFDGAGSIFSFKMYIMLIEFYQLMLFIDKNPSKEVLFDSPSLKIPKMPTATLKYIHKQLYHLNVQREFIPTHFIKLLIASCCLKCSNPSRL